MTESSTFLWETVYGKQRGVVQQAYDAMTDFIPRLLGGVYSHATPAIKRRLRQLRDDAKLATTSVQAALGGVDLSTGLRPLIDDTATALNLAKGAATSTSAFRDAVVGQRILVASKFFKLDERYLPQGWMQTTRRRVNMLMLDLTKPSQRLIDYVYGAPDRAGRNLTTADNSEAHSAPDLASAVDVSLGSFVDSADEQPRRRRKPSAEHSSRRLLQARPREPKSGRDVEEPLRRLVWDGHRCRHMLTALLPKRRDAPAAPRPTPSRTSPDSAPAQARL